MVKGTIEAPKSAEELEKEAEEERRSKELVSKLFVDEIIPNGKYELVYGIIMYDKPEEIIIPATGLASTLTYVLGTAVMGFGAIMLYRNEKEC